MDDNDSEGEIGLEVNSFEDGFPLENNHMLQRGSCSSNQRIDTKQFFDFEDDDEEDLGEEQDDVQIGDQQQFFSEIEQSQKGTSLIDSVINEEPRSG